jgi:Transposase IS116/IS110/IS902 family
MLSCPTRSRGHRKTAALLLMEIGPDMRRFPSHHLASWAGLCAGHNESAGKRKSGRTGKGSRRLRAGLTESARAAGSTRGSYHSAHYHRIKDAEVPARRALPSRTPSQSPPTTCSGAASQAKTSTTTTSIAPQADHAERYMNRLVR